MMLGEPVHYSRLFPFYLPSIFWENLGKLVWHFFSPFFVHRQFYGFSYDSSFVGVYIF